LPTCAECKLLVPNPKVEGYRCLGRRCGATKVTPDKDARRCTKFEKKQDAQLS
jgi:hypothetical protein